MPTPPPLIPPTPPPPTPEQIKREEDQRQVRLSYGRLFHSEHGQIVLKDLKARYGWDGEVERPSYLPGMDLGRTSNTDGMKEPVRHILAMMQPLPDKPEPKPTTAVTE